MNNTKSILVLFSLLSLVLFGVLSMGFYKIRIKNEETYKLLNTVSQADQAEILAQTIEAARTKAALDLETLNKLTFEEAKTVSLIEDVEQAGRDLGVRTQINAVNKTSLPNSPELELFKMTIEARGTWQNTFSYLKALESLPYRIVMENTNLKKEENEWVLRIVMGLHSFK
jgi:hypothetical protein